MQDRIIRIGNILLLILCLCMPFHSFFFSLFQAKPLVLWRDALICMLVIFLIVGKRFFIRESKEAIVIACSLILCAIHAFLFHDADMSMVLWGNSLRIYLIPFLAFFIGRFWIVEKKYYETIKQIYVYSAVIISVWGIFQMFFLGQDFLNEIGYGISSAVLADGFQRNVGIFSSANLMGVFLDFALLILLYSKTEVKFRTGLILFLFFSLLLTLSTSAIAGMFCAVVYKEVKENAFDNPKLMVKKLTKGLGILVIIVLVFYILDLIVLKGVLFEKIGIRINELIGAFINSEGRNTSASIHLQDLINSIQVVKEKPFGVGFSTSSFILLGRVDRVLLTYAVESSVFTIFFDFGIIIGCVYLFTFIYPIITGILKKNRKRNQISDLMAIQLLILYVLLPLVSSIELRFFFFLFAGLEEQFLHRDMMMA